MTHPQSAAGPISPAVFSKLQAGGGDDISGKAAVVADCDD